MARASWVLVLVLACCCSSAVSALGSLAKDKISASSPSLAAWSAGRVWNTVKRSAARLKTIQRRRGPGGRALRREGGDVPLLGPLSAALLAPPNATSTAPSSNGTARVPPVAGLLLQGLPVSSQQPPEGQDKQQQWADASGARSSSTAPRGLQQGQEDEQTALVWLERDREEDERAAARLVALQQRLNLTTEGERAAVRASVRDAAINMLQQAVAADQQWPAALPGSRRGPQQPSSSALQLPSRASALGDLLSPLRAKDDNTTTTNTTETSGEALAGPEGGDKQQQQALGALVGPSQRLQLTEQDQERIRQALREAAMVIVQRAAQQQREQLQLQGGLGGGALQALVNNRQKQQGGGPVLRLRAEEGGSSDKEGGGEQQQQQQQVGQPDGGLLVNPRGPGDTRARRGLQSSSSSSSASGDAPLLTVSLRPKLGDGDGGDEGGRLRRQRPLNLTDGERQELRQAVTDLASKVLHEMDDNNNDHGQQQSTGAGRREQPLLVISASQSEANPEVAALLSAARAVAAAASVTSAAKHHQHAAASQPDDLVFHHHQRLLPEDATATTPTIQQPPALPGQQQQQQQDDLAARLRTSLADRYNSLSDAEKAELQAAIRSAALALLREAAARDFGL